MLHGSLTKTGIAIELTGNQSDFAAFYHTISELVYVPENGPQAQPLDEYFLGFAYEFRKASEGLRNDENDNPRIRLLLISFLALVKSLRVRAGRQPTGRAIQGNLYWLEHIAIHAFFEGAGRVREALNYWLDDIRDHDPSFKTVPEYLNYLDYLLLEAGDDCNSRLEALPAMLGQLTLGGVAESFQKYEYMLSHQGEILDRSLVELYFNFGFPPEEEW